MSENTAKLYGTAIESAGIVLLWPFLATAFDKLNFTRERQFLDKASKENASRFLQFLVAGTNVSVLMKLLCGLEADAKVKPATEITLGKSEMRESLLRAFCDNSGIFQNTKIETVIETFLSRSGTLFEHDDHWQLIVKKHSFDVLLQRMPYSFSVLKFAWMEKPVFVEWQ